MKFLKYRDILLIYVTLFIIYLLFFNDIFQSFIILITYHIYKKNWNELHKLSKKKKRFICNSSISHLSVYYIKYWLQNNSISLFPWFPILFDVKEKNAIFLSLQGETLARITHKGRGGVYTIPRRSKLLDVLT